MARRSCHYIVTPTDLIDRPDIPDDSPIFRRYLKLLKCAWQETGAQYEHVTLSNVELADLWHVSEEAARKCLADMRELDLIESKQDGRTQRTIRLLVAWRGQGKDSAEDINATSTRAPRRVAPAPATGVPMRTKPQDQGYSEDGRLTPTLADSPNRVVVVGTDLNCLDKSVPTTTASTSTLARARTKAERNYIRDALWDLGIETDEAVGKILGDAPEMFRGSPRDYSHVTPEYVEDWLAHLWKIGKQAGLGAGYYRLQIREQRESPYAMSVTERAEYRAQNDEAWEHEKAARLDKGATE